MLLLLGNPALSQWRLDLEVSGFRADRNKVQIPNDSQGDRFEISDLGDDLFSAARLSLGWSPSKNYELQLVYAPFAYTEEGTFQQDVRFNGSTFVANESVKARYQFSSYRLRYLYHWIDDGRWKVDLGATLFIRDASIKLSQNGLSSEDDNLGAVPLFAFRSAYLLDNNWSLTVDTDLVISPKGRAVDLAILAQYPLAKEWSLAAGYRTIEGGADNDDIYNFAWFNGVVIKASYAW